MVTYLDILRTDKTYYKTGDMLAPIATSTWSAGVNTHQTLHANRTGGGYYQRYGTYFSTFTVLDTDEEGQYTIDNWIIEDSNFYLSLPSTTRPVFYVLKTPASPVLSTSVTDKTLTLTWSSTSIQVYKALIDWGDGSAVETVTKNTAAHTYAENGSYVISVTVVNRCEVSSQPTTQTVVIAEGITLIKHDTVYLLDNMRIVKPINATYRLVFSNAKTQATFTMADDPEVKCGMQIYLYHLYPQVFVIESISGERTITVTCLDYLTSLLKGRVSFIGTDFNDGYKVYSGNGGELIPYIITDNLSPYPRGSTSITAPESKTMGSDISIKTRFTVVSNILEEALRQAGLVLKSYIYLVNPLLIKCELVEPAVRNVNLTTRRLCGELMNRTNVRLATTALVAGKGSGASRETAWRGNTTSTDINRIETYVDGGESTETTVLEDEKGNTVIWKYSNNAPYHIHDDFWVGDTIYVNGIRMIVTQVDLAVSTNGESINLTLGYGFDGTDKAVYNIQSGMTTNFS